MPKIKNKSKQYLFKNKLSKRYKSKRELIKESFLMMISGLFLLLINYLIPQKIELFYSFNKNMFNIIRNLFEIISSSFEVLIVLIISSTLIVSIILIAGSISRIIKVILPKSKKFRFR